MRFLGRDSSAAVATGYGLDVSMMESRWGRDFSAPVQNYPAPHPASYTMGTGTLPGVESPGSGVDYPPPSSTEVKEREELYLYSSSVP